jgi:hypothetical protein
MTTINYEIINVGNAPNDGQGDPLRTAFEKINNNFAITFNTGIFNTDKVVTFGNSSQTIFSWPANNFTQATFQINSTDTTANTQSVTINATISPDLSTIRFTAQNTLFVGNPVTQYDMSVVSGNILLNVDPFVTGSLNHIVQYQLIPANANIALSLVTDQDSNAYLSTNNSGQLIVT